MLLTIDIGNTNLTIGLYDGKTLRAHFRLATDHKRMPDEYGIQLLGILQHAGCGSGCLEGICLASVVPPLTNRVVEACRQYLSITPLVVDVGIKTGVRIRYEEPRSVGADRVADAVAVHKNYGGPACVTAEEVRRQFDGEVDLILDGGRCAMAASTVIDLMRDPPVLLRQGAITRTMIEDAIGFVDEEGSGLQ